METNSPQKSEEQLELNLQQPDTELGKKHIRSAVEGYRALPQKFRGFELLALFKGDDASVIEYLRLNVLFVLASANYQHFKAHGNFSTTVEEVIEEVARFDVIGFLKLVNTARTSAEKIPDPIHRERFIRVYDNMLLQGLLHLQRPHSNPWDVL